MQSKKLMSFGQWSIQLTRVPLKIVFLRALVATIITAVLLMFVFYSYYSVHEFGHVFFGTIVSYLKSGEIPVFSTSAWDNCTGLDFIKCPQQTKWMGGGVLTGAFAFGGTIMVILVVTLVAAGLYKRTKNKAYLAFPIFFALYELIGNLLCGTDNLNGSPYGFCSTVPLMIIPSLSIIGIALLVFYIVNEEIDARISEKTVKKWCH